MRLCSSASRVARSARSAWKLGREERLETRIWERIGVTLEERENEAD
jgi:hypothetical protein